MFNTYEELENTIIKQGKTQESKNLLKQLLDKCKGEKKTPKEAFSQINQLIVNPDALGVC